MELIIYIKMDLALNNLQGLICHKTQQTKTNHLIQLIQFSKRTDFVYTQLNVKTVLY